MFLIWIHNLEHQVERFSVGGNFVVNINNEKNNRFIYEKDDIEIKNSQCDFCKYNNSNEKDVCIKYPNGKPEEIKQTKKRCEYLDIKK